MSKNVNVLQRFSKSPAYSSLKHGARTLATFPIVAYQRTLSFDHGPMKVFYPYGYCQFHPSCSEYCRRSILKDGIIKGYVKGAWRVVRCNPFSAGGVDEP